MVAALHTKGGIPSILTRPARVWYSLLFPQEVEILSSGSEAGANNAGDIGDSGDENDDSDFGGSSSGPYRKRSKKEQPSRGRGDGAASTKPTSRGNIKTNKKPPGTGKPKLHPASSDPGRPETPPDSRDTEGSPSSAEEATPLKGGTRLAVADEDAPSTAVINTSIFDLKENAKRRNAFQAGLQASLHNDEEPSIAAAGGGGSDGGADTGVTSAGGSSTASASHGKGKGAAAGRLKLTPMEQQVVDLKAKHPGVLLLVECGYRYRFFGEDALAAAKVSIICFVARTYLGLV